LVCLFTRAVDIPFDMSTELEQIDLFDPLKQSGCFLSICFDIWKICILSTFVCFLAFSTYTTNFTYTTWTGWSFV